MATSFPPAWSPWQPVHGILAAFPLALFTAALVADITYANTAQMQWANFAVWLIAGGVIMGLVAAIAGIADALTSRRVRRRSTALHSVATVAALVLAVINGFIHSRDAWTSVVPLGLILSLITTGLIVVSSWLGYSAGEPQRRVA